MSIYSATPVEVLRDLARRFKARRLALNLTQQGLADRSGVTWSSLKRFERTGLIALESLLKLALVLDCLPDFERVCATGTADFGSKSLDELLADTRRADTTKRRKGRIK